MPQSGFSGQAQEGKDGEKHDKHARHGKQKNNATTKMKEGGGQKRGRILLQPWV